MVAVAVEVRAFVDADASATWQVFHAAVRQTAIRDYSQEQVNAWAPDSVNLALWRERRQLARTLVAVLDATVVGFGDVTDEGLLDMLFVHPDWGRRGVARRLVAEISNHAREMGLLRLHTHASRTARPALERLGFVVDHINDTNWIRGQNLPNYDMHLDLDRATIKPPPDGR